VGHQEVTAHVSTWLSRAVAPPAVVLDSVPVGKILRIVRIGKGGPGLGRGGRCGHLPPTCLGGGPSTRLKRWGAPKKVEPRTSAQADGRVRHLWIKPQLTLPRWKGGCRNRPRRWRGLVSTYGESGENQHRKFVIPDKYGLFLGV